MPQNYVIIGGGAYQPGSAAYNLALKLNQQYSKPAAGTTVPYPSVPSPSAPATTAPAAFPSYPTTTRTMTTGAGVPSLVGAGGMSGKGAYGLVPQVPNPIATAGGSIAGNQANLPSLGTLGSGTTKLAANLGVMPYQANLPGYDALTQASSANILSNLQGVIDPNTWAAIQQHMGERGVAMGISPSSPNFNTAMMRALGETATAEEALGQQQLNAAVARTPTGQAFNLAGQQISPGDLQAAQWQSNMMAAAPDPTMAAQANLDMLLKSIEAGRTAGMGGVGGLGGGSAPRTSGGGAPVVRSVPVNYGGYGYGGGGGSGFAPSPVVTAPGAVPPSWSLGPEYNPQPWTAPGEVDYSSGEGVPPAILDLANQLQDPYSLGGYDFNTGSDYLSTDSPPYDPYADWGY